jgi:hypothetical protein
MGVDKSSLSCLNIEIATKAEPLERCDRKWLFY